MIISHSKRFIFIKTRKTAGSSLQRAFARACQPGDIFISNPNLLPPWGTVPEKFRKEDPHVGKDWIRKRFPREWRQYTKITAERHPLEKVVSLYWWSTVKDDPRPAFAEWFGWFSDRRFTDFDLYGNRAGAVLADHVILYEDLEAGYERVCQAADLETFPLGEAKSRIRPMGDRAADHFSEGMLQRMRRIFRREMNAFAYSF